MDTQTTAPQSPTQRVGAVGQETTDATKGVAATAGHEAERVTREAKDQVRQLWGQTRSELTDQASVQQSRAAAGLRELGDQLGSMASSGGQDGMARGLVEDVARRAEDAAAWLDQREPGTLLEEARDFARRRPGTFLALAAGVGLVAGAAEPQPRGRGTRLRLCPGHRGDRHGSGRLLPRARHPAAGPAPRRAALHRGHGTTGGIPPTATSPASSTASTPTTSGATPAAVAAGAATVPSQDVPGDVHRTTQPIAPDGTPTPITAEGHLGAPRSERRERRRTGRAMTEQQTRPDLPDPSLRSVGELLGDITADLSTLMRQEMDLAKAELRETVDHAKAGGSMLGGAAVAGQLALLFLSLALWWALGDLIGLGWSALVVGLLWAVVAGALAAAGRARLRQMTPVAQRTIDTTKDIPDALRGHETA